ncbi:hypothetical protein LZ30DRAFT_385013 [Colletotrichum cereale]|nr:hypothetical protein LZ30DRAFT_385013 [Colletotrichum cereale]
MSVEYPVSTSTHQRILKVGYAKSPREVFPKPHHPPLSLLPSTTNPLAHLRMRGCARCTVPSLGLAVFDDFPPGSEIGRGGPSNCLGSPHSTVLHKISNGHRVDSAAKHVYRQSILHCRGFLQLSVSCQFAILLVDASLFSVVRCSAAQPGYGRTRFVWMSLKGLRHGERRGGGGGGG